jgi:hypothetical protein
VALFNIIVDIAARTAGLESGIDKVNKKLEGFGDGVKRVFEFAAVGAVLEFTKRVIELGDGLQDSATKAGVTSKAFTELAYAAKLNNGSADSLATAFVKMNVALSNAASGGKSQNEALAALGLTYKQLQDLAPEDMFTVISDRISKLGKESDKARVETELFGRAGADLAPLFEKGAAGILKMRQEAENVRQSFSAETLQALEDAHKSIDRLSSSFSGLALILTSKVAPALADSLDQLTALVSGQPQLAAQANLRDARAFLAARFDDRAALDVGNRMLASANAAVNAQQFIVDPNSLRISGLLDLPKPPGYGPDLDKLLPGVHPGLSKQSTALDVNPAVQQFLQSTSDLQSPYTKAFSEYNRTIAELGGALQDNAIPLEDFQTRMENATDKLKEAIDLQPFYTNLQKLPDILTENQRAIRDFSDDVKGSLASAFHESGSFAKNFTLDLLRALEDRAIFKAIDAIGDALERALNSHGGGAAGSIGGFFGSLVTGLITGGAGGGTVPAESTGPVHYGGPKAAGGPLEMGKWYTAGEHGPEAIWGGGPGAFAAGYGGGGQVINIKNNIDARGATVDLIQALPAILKQNNDALEARIVQGYRRGKYG